MSIKNLAIGFVFVVFFSIPAVTSTNAACNTFGSITTCNDLSTGNSYTTTRMGNSSFTSGRNARTGSTWSQNSTKFGNTTNIYGRASNGNSWNSTITPNSVSGRDSSGNSFFKLR